MKTGRAHEEEVKDAGAERKGGAQWAGPELQSILSSSALQLYLVYVKSNLYTTYQVALINASLFECEANYRSSFRKYSKMVRSRDALHE